MSKVSRMLERLYERRPDLRAKHVEEEHKKAVQKSHEPLIKSQLREYSGPMSISDINIASWNEFFAEGGNLNQPTWLQTPRLKAIRRKFEFLSRYHI